jgi:Rod binding domain-containing protein
MNLSPVNNTTSAAAGGTAPPVDPAKIKKAAADFEALLISNLLRSARQSGSLGGDEQSAGALMDLAEQQFSQLLAANGGLGLARLVVQGLAPDGGSVTVHSEPPASLKSSAMRSADSGGI